MDNANNNNKKREKKSTVIGIDLGTTFSLVGFWKVAENGKGKGSAQVLESEEGSVMIPSCVSFLDNGDELVGQEALLQRLKNRKNTIFDQKRVIGRKIDDEIVQKMVGQWPFTVVADEAKRPMVKIERNGQMEMYSPTQIQTKILEKLRETAQLQLGYPIYQAVITHPAYFGQLPKQETITAARDAGFEIVRLLSEPTAAAYFYGFDEKRFDGYNLLVFDLGGGTFDCTVLEVRDHEFYTIKVDGIENLGGRDFDQALMEMIGDRIWAKYLVNVMADPDSKQKLLLKCQTMKERLSTSQSESISLLDIADVKPGNFVDPILNVTRAEFETKCMPMAERCMQKIRNVIEAANLRNDQIDEILMVGGSSRIPMFHRLLKAEFDVKRLNFSIDADEAVVQGATLRAAQYCERVRHSVPCELRITETTPLSIGILGYGDKFVKLIEKGTQYPVKKSQKFVRQWLTGHYSPAYVIVEGERLVGLEGIKELGTLPLKDLMPDMVGTCETTVTLRLDEDGILQASAWNSQNRQLVKLTIDYKSISVARTEGVEAAKTRIDEAECHIQEDRQRLLRNEAIKKLEDEIHKTKWQLHDTSTNFPSKAKQKKEARDDKFELCKKFEKWFAENGNKAPIKVIEEKVREFQVKRTKIEENEGAYEESAVGKDSSDEENIGWNGGGSKRAKMDLGIENWDEKPGGAEDDRGEGRLIKTESGS